MKKTTNEKTIFMTTNQLYITLVEVFPSFHTNSGGQLPAPQPLFGPPRLLIKLVEAAFCKNLSVEALVLRGNDIVRVVWQLR